MNYWASGYKNFTHPVPRSPSTADCRRQSNVESIFINSNQPDIARDRDAKRSTLKRWRSGKAASARQSLKYMDVVFLVGDTICLLKFFNNSRGRLSYATYSIRIHTYIDSESKTPAIIEHFWLCSVRKLNWTLIYYFSFKC